MAAHFIRILLLSIVRIDDIQFIHVISVR